MYYSCLSIILLWRPYSSVKSSLNNKSSVSSLDVRFLSQTSFLKSPEPFRRDGLAGKRTSCAFWGGRLGLGPEILNLK